MTQESAIFKEVDKTRNIKNRTVPQKAAQVTISAAILELSNLDTCSKDAYNER